jgi:4-hydroxybenzoate polyprenyltransferase
VPLPWALAVAALLGLGAHFANVLPDLAGDRAAGVRGLPHTVAALGGELTVRLVALTLLLGASVLLAVAPGTGPRTSTAVWLTTGGLVAAVALGAVAVRSRGRTPFRCALAIAALDVVMFAASGGALTGS